MTFGTGIVDALSWVVLSGVFTANMTGNVLIVGMGIVGAGGSHWFPSLFALAWFLIGAGVVGATARHAAPGWGRRTTVVFAAVAGTLTAVAVFAAFWQPHRLDAGAFAATAAMALAMGAQGAEAMRLAVPGLITIAVSSATVGVGMSLFLGLGARGSGVARRLAAIVLLCAGAFVGALLSPHGLAPGLLVAAAVAGLATAVGHRQVREAA
ncbi:DUF1275 domain-containing protein [Microbacterium sp. zg.Y1090]|uniref:YoaK family protein n=1 Tax=Microbacterium TaxID=33882 RepID=UPI00214CD572|nr:MULTISPECIES: YoaK family protein [unclassified Microbacterium]MCR2812520.1 DUF1275 domain-containing protein [Microbacterium sp. zg.Y1084]MCR2817679.1 DUF1275 domain-containing protein [Microbacterium sp. zg.Y1090]MDL5485678.1 YoaK family protein [Microbacterium sp. zg-Y1211]WIM28847.1 YoaK family protein [Microbacterium sp. zg-Y1090]